MRLLKFTLILMILSICWTPNFANINCPVSVSSTNGIVTITGLTSVENVKLFDANISSVWECNPWNGSPCSGNEVVNNLPTGSYFLSVQSDNCSEWIPITVESSGGCTDLDNDGVCADVDCDDNNPNLPALTGSACNDNDPNTITDIIQADGCTCAGISIVMTCAVSVSSSNGIVTITGLTPAENTKLFDANISTVWECNPWNGTPCSGNEVINNLPTGSYFLSVQSDVCNEWIPVTVDSSGGCTDLDNDGVCADVDCDDNDPNLPATPGSTCDDNNPNTINDIILSDGCSCEGTIDNCIDADNDGVCAADDCDDNNPNLPAAFNSPCDDNNPNTTNDIILFGGCVCAGTPTAVGCNVAVTSSNGNIVITGLTGVENAKLFDSVINQGQQSIVQVWECNPWNGTPCSGNEVISGMENGQYFLSVNSDVCDEWIPVLLTGSNGPVCPVSVEVTDDIITINGMDGDTNVQVVSDDNVLVFACSPGYGSPFCSDLEIVKPVPNGAYTLYVESDVCDEAIPITIDYEFACDMETTISNVSCDGVNITYDIFVTGTNTDDNFFFLNVPTENFPDLVELEYGQTHTIAAYTNDYDDLYAIPFDSFDSNCYDIEFIECPDPQCDTYYGFADDNTIALYELDASLTTQILNDDLTVFWECSPSTSPCVGTILITIPDGDYFLSVQSDICDEMIPVIVGEGSGIDTDGDGWNDTQDCKPNDPTLPAPYNTPCDDGNDLTTNDKVQLDLCTCAGTPVAGACNISYTETGIGQITITSLTSLENTKLFDATASSTGVVWECNPWSGACSGTEVVNGLIPGEQYFLAVQSDNCNDWIPITLTMTIYNGSGQSFQQSTDGSEDSFEIQNLFPNPATTETFVKIESTFDGDINLEIYDVVGGLQSRSQVNMEEGNNTFKLDITNLDAGIYHLILTDEKGQSKSTRMVVGK